MAGALGHPYLPTTPEQREEMLRAIGVPSVEELFRDIPEGYRDPPLDLPPPKSEVEVRREVEALSRQNIPAGEYACFLGGGAARHFVPSVVRALLSRGEFLTAYTPYQPEASQGTLQATYEFQTLVCLLTGMEVANAGMYDGASALAEAALMACRVTGRARIVMADTVNPRYREVVETYTLPQGLALRAVPPEGLRADGETACLLVQYPDFFGYVEDLSAYAQEARRAGALLVVATDPIALGLLRPPGDYGADIVVGECGPLSSGLSFGGPYLGLLACRERFLRQMPGRIVGRTTDTRGRTGYVLTLQTREQHIRRERATSNICTAEALVATGVAVYLAALGKNGLRKVAEACYHKAHYAASLLARLPGYQVHPLRSPRFREGPDGPLFFKEFLVRCPRPPGDVLRGLLARRILGGLDVSDRVPGGLLICVTEMNTREEIEALAEALGELGKGG